MEDKRSVVLSTEERSRQEQQAVLVEQGEKMAGVAEAMDVYRKFAPYVPNPAMYGQPVTYSTGGNV